MLMFWSRGLCGLCLLILMSVGVAQGQAVSAAQGGGQTLWLGADYSNLHAGFPEGSELRFSSLGMYGVFNWNHQLGAEGESRFFQFNGYHGETEKDLLAGPRYTFLHNPHWGPYAALLLGGTRVKYPFTIGVQSFFTVAPAGGVEYRLNYRWSVRGEYQYDFLHNSPNFTDEPHFGIRPDGFRVGVSYRLFR
jgi:opacity protein-like surface antigen